MRMNFSKLWLVIICLLIVLQAGMPFAVAEGDFNRNTFKSPNTNNKKNNFHYTEHLNNISKEIKKRITIIDEE